MGHGNKQARKGAGETEGNCSNTTSLISVTGLHAECLGSGHVSPVDSRDLAELGVREGRIWREDGLHAFMNGCGFLRRQTADTASRNLPVYQRESLEQSCLIVFPSELRTTSEQGFIFGFRLLFLHQRKGNMNWG